MKNRALYGLLSLRHQANSIEFKLGLRKRLQLGWGICGWPFAQSAKRSFGCFPGAIRCKLNDSGAMLLRSF
jgi:hypothetical protein